MTDKNQKLIDENIRVSEMNIKLSQTIKDNQEEVGNLYYTL